MAYAQWMVATIVSNGTTISIKNATLAWGKFFQNPDKDKELTTDVINKITIPSGTSANVASCGREDAASGTEGSFDLYDGTTKIGTFYWDCPWGSKANIWSWTPNSAVSNYVTQATGFNLDSGALGNGTITCVKIS